jgi:hypothetical protein
MGPPFFRAGSLSGRYRHRIRRAATPAAGPDGPGVLHARFHAGLAHAAPLSGPEPRQRARHVGRHHHCGRRLHHRLVDDGHGAAAARRRPPGLARELGRLDEQSRAAPALRSPGMARRGVPRGRERVARRPAQPDCQRPAARGGHGGGDLGGGVSRRPRRGVSWPDAAAGRRTRGVARRDRDRPRRVGPPLRRRSGRSSG